MKAFQSYYKVSKGGHEHVFPAFWLIQNPPISEKITKPLVTLSIGFNGEVEPSGTLHVTSSALDE